MTTKKPVDDRTIHAGLIALSKSILLEMLDFKGGNILGIHDRDEYYNPDTIHVIIEHPDMPELHDGDALIPMNVMYRADYDDGGNLIKRERIDPPKKEEES